MPFYYVIWTTAVYAGSAEEAARAARKIQQIFWTRQDIDSRTVADSEFQDRDYVEIDPEEHDDKDEVASNLQALLQARWA